MVMAILTGQGCVEQLVIVSLRDPAYQLQLPMSRMFTNSLLLYLVDSLGVPIFTDRVSLTLRVGSRG